MKFTFHLFLICFLFFGASVSKAQQNTQGTCGTVLTPEALDYYMKQLPVAEQLVNQKSGATIYIPVVFHSLATDEGTGRLSDSLVFASLCKLNQFYADQSVVFYMPRAINYVNKTVLYIHDKSSASSSTNLWFNYYKNQAGFPKAVNVFIGENCDGSTTGTTTTLGYFSPNLDILFLRKTEINGTSSTFAHEAGHFLSLMHPHNGWDGATPPAAFKRAPVDAPNGGLTEKQSRTAVKPASCTRTGASLYCQCSGDFLCDTGPDYNFGLGATGCNYVNHFDSDSILVDPTEANIMGYFLACGTEFSASQKALVLADIRRRNYHTAAAPANLTLLTTAPANVSPANNDTNVHPFDAARLEWSAVPGADFYYYRVFRVNPLTGVVLTTVAAEGTTSNLYAEVKLGANLPYAFNVRPINAASTCPATFVRSGLTRFTTIDWGVSVEGAEAFAADVKVYPNPASNQISVELPNEFETISSIKLINQLGQVVASYVPTEQTAIHLINLNSLASGIYTVSINTTEFAINKRLVVNK